tara:strand:+ start:69 stop:338 length:270 start_codon:yes stop_codon:yes gene_type:complete
MSLEKNNLHNQQRRDHMVGSLSNALLDSKQAIKALWNEEYNSTTQKRLQNFIEKGIIKVLRVGGERGKIYVPRKEIDKFLQNVDLDNSN